MKGKKDNGSSVKKPIYKKWWFWVIIVVLLSAIFGNMGSNDATTPNAPPTPTQSETADNTQSGDNSSESEELSAQSQTVCRALTNLFVKNVVGEKWHMLAFSVESYELDENENGTIEVLYMPPDAGNGETKVNLTIEKSDDTYAITYALLAGIYEVDLSTVSNNYKTLTN